MPYIPPEVVAKAKEMDLLTYLKNYEPGELVHFGGNTYCTRIHDSLKISNGKSASYSAAASESICLYLFTSFTKRSACACLHSFSFRTISGNPRQFNYRDESAEVCISAQYKL